jgi:4-oxalocrotonate tautomerase
MPVVEISLFTGRTADQKLSAARAISGALVEHLNATPESVQVIFRDVQRSDWVRPADLVEPTGA